MRRAARTDTTQKAIVEALRQAGALVWSIGLYVDLLVYVPRLKRLFLMDCKTPHGRKGTIQKTVSQEALEAQGWPIGYPRSPEEALRLIGAIR